MTKNGVIKIVDFGMSCHMNSDTMYDKTQVGKVKFAAPEIYTDQNYNA